MILLEVRIKRKVLITVFATANWSFSSRTNGFSFNVKSGTQYRACLSQSLAPYFIYIYKVRYMYEVVGKSIDHLKAHISSGITWVRMRLALMDFES